MRRQSPASATVGVLRALARTACLSADIVVLLTGCFGGKVSSTIVQKAASPDGNSIALFIDRAYHIARASNEFVLIVVPHARDLDEAVADKAIGDSAAFVATYAGGVRLHWQGNDTLVVVCDSCGLRPLDIEKRLDRLGRLQIVYRGVPQEQ